MYYIGDIPYGDKELYHFGIKGMRWGVRRYRNEDGTLTAAGKERYSSGEGSGSSEDRVANAKNKKSFQKLSDHFKRGGDMFDVDGDERDKAIDYIYKKESKLLDSWWDNKFKYRRGEYDDETADKLSDKQQQKYARQLAKNLGLPYNKETEYFLVGYFLTYDD